MHPDLAGAGKFETAFRSALLNSIIPAGQASAPCQSLLITNTPASVNALTQSHNVAHVRRATRIIIQLFLNSQGTTYSELAVRHWEDFVGGTGGRCAPLSDALVFSSKHCNQTRAEVAASEMRNQFWDTTYHGSARGTFLCSRVNHVFHDAPASKELVFLIFRDTTQSNTAPPDSSDMAIGPNLHSFRHGIDDQGDISLLVMERLARLQKPDVPVFVAMQRIGEDREQVAQFIKDKTGLCVQFISV